MIKIFRKIHYDLIGKNKTGKYLKYAIGEILLVVIGILFALQINNWNEERKVRDHESVLLRELRNEMTFNRDDIIQTLVTINNSIKSNEILASLFENNQTYHDSLNVNFEK